MKRLSFVLSCVGMVFGCSRPAEPQGSRTAADASATPSKEKVLASAGDVRNPSVAPYSPHTFVARPHPPHTPPQVGTVDLSRLPPLRLRECFGGPSDALAGPTSPRRPLPMSGGGGMGFSYGMGSGNPGGAKPKAAGAAKRTRTLDGDAPMAAPAEAHAASPPPPAPAPTAAAPRAETQRRAEEKSTNARGRSEPMADKLTKPEVAREEAEIARDDAPVPGYHDYGASIYLSNDDTMSLSSAQRILFAIDRYLPLPAEHIRPHELLNYFSFETAPIAPNDDFSVYAEIEPKPGKPGEFTLGLSVSGRFFSKEERRNAALTFVIDRSGSMSAEGRMEYLKRGLLRMTNELKRGDIVNLVAFDHQVCTPVENFVVGRDSMRTLTNTLGKLEPRGSTDVDLGLRTGYELADKAYQSGYTNRVVLITDALANTGETSPEAMATVSAHYDKRRIRLSGVGVGTEFNDGLLDRLTERGRGAYVFLGSPAEVDAVFGERFVSLIETTANDVHFKLQLPPSLRMNVFYGEESSTVKADVQAVHYFAGTSQLFLSDLMSKTGALPAEDSVMLSVEYEHPETGAKQFEDFAFALGEIAKKTDMVKKGRLITSFVDGLADTARSAPMRSDTRVGGWIDAAAAEQCARGHASLAEQSAPLARDPEVTRVVELWDKYCSRYEPARAPVHRTPPTGRDVWPSAQR